MSRVVLYDAAPWVETAVLQAGHQVLRLTQPRGGWAGLTKWRSGRTAQAFMADCVMAADGAEAAALARTLGVARIDMPGDSAFLLPRHLPLPFRATAPLMAGPPGPILPDIAMVRDEKPDVLAGCLAAGCAVVAPDTPAMRRAFGPRAALYHDPSDPAAVERLANELLADPARCETLRQAARAEFEARHAAARAALRQSLASVGSQA